MSSLQRTRVGCHRCRRRHLKCDEGRPSCLRCQKSGDSCVRELNIRFRHGANPSVQPVGSEKPEFEFGRSQPWVKTAPSLVFLDAETQSKGHDGDDTSSVQSTTSVLTSDSECSPDLQRSFRNNESRSASRHLLHRTTSAPQVVSDVSEKSDVQEWSADSLSQRTPSSLQSPGLSFRPQLESWPSSSYSEWGTSPNACMNTPPSNPTARCVLLTDYQSFDSPERDALLAGNSNDSGGTTTQSPQTLLGLYIEAPAWPLARKEEADLLRYYVERLARDFDLTDPERHFRHIVPQRAATCPLLLNAIFALSARHLSRVGDYDPLVSNKYHQECLERVTLVLDEPATLLDENLLASTIILRHLEEFEVPISGSSPGAAQTHLLGSHAFLQAQNRAAKARGLRQAAFWVGLRQEIYVAFVNQRSIATAFQGSTLDWTSEAPGDHGSSNRMVALCADVMRFCFGEDNNAANEYDRLVTAVDEWFASKSYSFTPVYCKEPDESNVFPDIRLLSDEVISGLHHYYIAKLLLCAHNPRIPRLGPSRAATLRSTDEEIKGYVRILCGIAISNPDTAPNFTYASMAIAAAGDKFTEAREQEALLHVLEICDSHYAFPTGHTGENLKAAWGWTQDVR